MSVTVDLDTERLEHSSFLVVYIVHISCAIECSTSNVLKVHTEFTDGKFH